MKTTAPTTDLVFVLDASGLDATKTQVLSSRFADYFDIAEHWNRESLSLTVTNEDQTELMKRARQGRLVLKDKRVQIERTRKELKEESLKEGRAIDNVAKLLTSLIEPTEQFLLEQEEFAVRAAQKRLEERQRLINARRAHLQEYGDDDNDNWLATASASQYGHRVEVARKFFAENQAKLEAERERQRQLDQRNRDELLKENQRLQDEQRQRDEAAATERRALEAQLQKQRDETQKLRDAETKRRRDQQQAQQFKTLSVAADHHAPDKAKLRTLSDSIGAIALPQASTEQGQKVIAAVGTLLGKVRTYLGEQAELF